MAVAGGWLERAARLLDDVPLCAEHAWLAVREAEVALAGGEPAVARAAAGRAIAIAEQLALEDVQVVGRSLEGLSLVHQGRVDDGMRRLDESAVAATAGDVKDLMWVGKVCCNLIAACDRVGDVERATEWCAQVREFAQRWELRTLFNVCRTQYASVLMQTGEWTEAESELTTALAVFAGGRRGPLVSGTAQLGELRRRQGRLDEARALFTQSEASWAARIGSVELALDEGDTATAFALAERLERATEDGRRLDRVAVLTLLARTAVAAGRVDRALEASAELDVLADSIGTTRARAAAAHAGGESAFASGDLERARTRARGRDRSARRLRDALRAGAGAARTRPGALQARLREPRARGSRDRARVHSSPSTRAGTWRPLHVCSSSRRPRRAERIRSPGESVRCSRSWPPVAATARSPASSWSASTPCTGMSRTSCASSTSRHARQPPRTRPATASSDRPEPALARSGHLSRRPRDGLISRSDGPARSRDSGGRTSTRRSQAMPLIQVKLIENVFNSDQKREIIERLTDAMVEIEGENMRPVTWVTIEEVASGEWGIAGNALTTSDVKALQAGVPA